MRRGALLLSFISAAAGGVAAEPLAPAEVLVVANEAVDESVALAKHYLAARDIPAKNLLTVRTKPFRVAFEEYEQQVAGPVRKHLRTAENGEAIRCVCLLWGMPLHLASPYQQFQRQVRERLWRDLQYLGQIGREFPDPGDAPLNELERHFAALPEPKRLPPLQDLVAAVEAGLPKKQDQAAAVEDPARRAIALRQALAMTLELQGLDGVLEYVRRADPPGAGDAASLKKLLAEARAERPQAVRTVADYRAVLRSVLRAEGVLGARAFTRKRTKPAHKDRAGAAVDSELATVLWDTDVVRRWALNPLHWRMQRRRGGPQGPRTLMTCRIDGPRAEDARRLIDDAVAVEKTGLTGVLYVDAGGPQQRYDRMLELFGAAMQREADLPIVLDTEKAVFAKGACPNAALYVGWYSLRKYVPAFDWKRGAVGWHVASFEAIDLRNPKSREWCPQMLRHGVAATVGAVAEPYLSAFPMPGEFFPLLLTGRLSLAECYWRTVPHASWQLTLIGDPLYRPFAAKPRFDPDHLPAGLLP